jgi:hypothetical protein
MFDSEACIRVRVLFCHSNNTFALSISSEGPPFCVRCSGSSHHERLNLSNNWDALINPSDPEKKD